MANTTGYVNTEPVEKKKTLALPKTTAPVEQVKNPAQQGDAQLPVQQPGGNAQTMSTAAPANTTTNTASAAKHTTLNDQIWGADGTGLKGYEQQLETQRQNGGAATAYEDEAFRQQLIAAGIDPAKLNWYTQNGGYTQNREDAIAKGGTGEAAENFYEDGTWYYYPRTEREVQAGTSGADEAHLSDASYAYIQYCKEMYAKATTPEDKAYWHNEAEKTRARAGYSGGADGSMYIPLAQLELEQAIQDVISQDSNSTVGSNNSTIGTTTPTPEKQMQALLDEWKDAALKQTNGQVDFAVAQAIKDLERALEDAQPQFKEQAESVSLEERQAMDNAALYAELRGDKGGIGQEQYSSIQNTAAQNRLAVQQAQTKLSTDTARQIEDLRAQGEFEKADKALEITQNYLAQLVALEQWAEEYKLTTDQFNASLKQWEAEYQMALQQMGIAQNQWQQEFQFAQDQFNTSKDQWNAEYQMALQQMQNAQNQWQQEFNFAQDKFNTSNNQWNAEYQMALQQMQNAQNQWQQEFNFAQGQYGDKLSQVSQNQLSEMGWSLLSAGMVSSITDEQLKAMGFSSREVAQSYYDAMTAADSRGDLAEMGWSLLSAGMVSSITDEQLKAMGFSSREVAQSYYDAMTAANSHGDLAEMGWTWFNAGKIEKISDEQLKAMGFNSRDDAKELYDALAAASQTSTKDVNSYYSMLYQAGYKPKDESSILALLTSMGLSSKDAAIIYNAYADREYASMQASTNGNEGWGDGLPTAKWVAVYFGIMGAIDSGDVDGVQKILEKYQNEISREQWTKIQEAMDKAEFDPNGLSWLD